MAETSTTNYGWIKPENGASADSWGISWNANADAIDGKMKEVSDVAAGAQTAAAASCVKLANLSDVAHAETARTNLGLAIGTNVQPYHATLAALAGLGNAANQVPYFTGGTSMNWFASTTLSRALMGESSSAGMRTQLGIPNITNTGVYVQPDDPGGADGTVWMW